MTTCTDAEFQKLKAKLIANGDLPVPKAQATGKAVIDAAARHAAMIETSISKAIAAVNASPAVALETKPVAKTLSRFEQTIARVKAEQAANGQPTARPTAQAYDLADRAKGLI